MQDGLIYKKSGSWLLQYRRDEIVNGKVVRKRVATKLAPVRYAKRTDAISENPVRDSAIPRGKSKSDTPAYTLDEIQAMLAALKEPARTCVLVAALTGLRQSEIRGLRWDDFRGDELLVARSV